MQKLRLLFALLCCTLAGLAQTPDDIPKARTKPQWATLTDSVYAIHYPQNWSLDQSGMFGSSFFIYAPFDGPNDKFRENFNLIVNDLREFPGISLKELADGSRQQIINMISDVKILEFKEVTAENDTYYLLEYTGKQGQYNLHWKQEYRMFDNYFYVLTFTAEEKQFTSYLPLADNIFASFFLK